MRIDRMQRSKPLFFFGLFSSIMLLALYTSVDNGNSFLSRIYYIGKSEDGAFSSSVLSTPSFDSNLSCNMPLYISPFDEATKPYMKKLHLSCNTEPDVTFVDNDGILKQKTSFSKYWCKYSFIKRKPYDQSNEYTVPRTLSADGVRLPEESPYVNVTCFKKEAKSFTVHRTAHMHIPKFNVSSNDAPSVMVLVLESLSRLSYFRYMHKTREAMAQLGNFQLLEGLTKVGRNSFPNSFALLVGKAMQDEDCMKIKGPWDRQFDYIWDRFKAKNYVTGFTEDMAQAGLFTYYSNGFSAPPTHWYPTPFWVNMYPIPGYYQKHWYNIWNQIKNYCFETRGNKANVFLESLLNFDDSVKKNNQSYFLYAFYSQSTHNLISSYQYVDESFAQFINKLKGRLNNTVFIFMGDHGQMHGPYTTTTLGHFEGSMPLFGIRVPESLDEKFPHLRELLELNKSKLTSWFDVRLMLLDIVSNNYTKVKSEKETGPLSPWREHVPNHRECKDAGIPENWCVCNGITGPMPFSEQYYRKIVDRAFKKLNEALEGLNCDVKLFVESVRKMNHVLPHQSEKIALKEQLRYVIKVKNFPVLIEMVFRRERKSVNSRWSDWTLRHRNYASSIERLCHLHEYGLPHIFL